MKNISALSLLLGLLFIGTACERHPIAETMSVIEEKGADKHQEEKPCPDCAHKETPTVEVHPSSAQ